MPEELTVATAELLTVQLAIAETSLDVPSAYVAVAENCWVVPAATLGVEGETPIPVTVFAALPDIDGPPPHPAITMHNKIWGKIHSN
jgi:hypothetical protein